LTDSKIIFDTSALIEFFQETEKGAKIKDYFISEEVKNLIPAIVISELISKLKREKIDPLKFICVLEKNCTILNLNFEVSKKAGFLHGELKKTEPDISLVDCIIMAHGDLENSKIISLDKHFKNYKNAIIF
jgi:predicted nucleic acid-binding protein